MLMHTGRTVWYLPEQSKIPQSNSPGSRVTAPCSRELNCKVVKDWANFCVCPLTNHAERSHPLHTQNSLARCVINLSMHTTVYQCFWGVISYLVGVRIESQGHIEDNWTLADSSIIHTPREMWGETFMCFKCAYILVFSVTNIFFPPLVYSFVVTIGTSGNCYWALINSMWTVVFENVLIVK